MLGEAIVRAPVEVRFCECRRFGLGIEKFLVRFASGTLSEKCYWSTNAALLLQLGTNLF